MRHIISGARRWWQQVVICCSRCGSVDMWYRKTDRLWVCNRCGKKSGGKLLSTPENRPLIRQLRAAWRGRSTELFR
jgi:ribosomal protein L37AE/L43A